VNYIPITKTWPPLFLALVALAMFLTCYPVNFSVHAQDEPRSNPAPTKEKPGERGELKPPKVPLTGQKPRWRKLLPDSPVWVDPKQKLVIIDGEVCLTQGPLEMFACLKHTKEHESIVSVPTRAYVVHAALLAVGARPGKPVQFRPTYQRASGTEIEVFVLWKDKAGKEQTARAQDWMRDASTKKRIDAHFVFAGSGFWKDEATGRKHYRAEGGDLICVANFPSATLDVTVKSSDSNESLLFEAFTQRIPAAKTPVRLVLRPKLSKPSKSRRRTIP